MNVAPVWLALIAFAASAAAAPTSLEGVWGATRYFGPDVRGTLEVTRSAAGLRARVGKYEAAATEDRGRVRFELPDRRGSFTGRFEQGGAVIRGYWTQAASSNTGAPYVSPLVLRADASRNRWAGEVRPLDDEFTMYLVVSSDGGATKAYIRNPDRNLGLSMKIDRVERDGDRMKLVGKWRGRGEDRVFAEGVLRSGERMLSLYFPNRNATYDFTPIDQQAGFLARAKSAGAFEYRAPIAVGDGWKTGTLSQAGVDFAPIRDFVEDATADPKSVESLDLHALLIARHGKLVFEEYFHGYHRDRPHETRSAGKTLATMLVGAQMQRGAKLSTATRVYELLPGADNDERKRAMTLEHLLTMSSGYDCDDWDGSRPGSEDHILDDAPDEDYYRYTLRLPMEMAPGTQAVYCSINPNLVGAVVRAATQRPVVELFDETVARPLQFGRYYLNLQPTGEPYLGGGANLLPRDFMKFGQVMLDGGTWNGVRILPRDFARKAGSPLMTLRGQKPGMHYGYLWWTVDYPYRGRTITAYFASGNGGQEIVVVPEADMVIGAFGGNYGSQAGWAVVREYIPKYVLPAIRDR
jgi:CubicO group peptidase (beta-lactamase class C family)